MLKLKTFVFQYKGSKKNLNYLIDSQHCISKKVKDQYLHEVRSAPFGALVFTSSAHLGMNIWL